jgi:hypothetical protein
LIGEVKRNECLYFESSFGKYVQRLGDRVVRTEHSKTFTIFAIILKIQVSQYFLFLHKNICI